MRKINLTLLLSMMSIFCFAQNQFDIRFNLTSIDCQSGQACYDVQLKSSNGFTWNLAGQNYRLYYDNGAADFLSGTSTLGSDYGPFTLVQDAGPVNATANSTILGFESELGFINYTMDLSNLNSGGIQLSSTWMTTSNLCFSIDPAVINTASECIELVWGRDGLTNDLATAFVEVSSWDGINMTSAATAILHDDLDSSDGDAACFDVACFVPVPDITITDGSTIEGGSASVDVCLSIAASQDVTINYSTIAGTANSAVDFISQTSSITILQGQTCSSITINTIDDSNVEGPENFTVVISNPSFGNIADNSAVITITDNDVACAAQAPVLSGN